MEGELVTQSSASALQSNDDVKLLRKSLASGVWEIPATVYSELPRQCQLVTLNLRYKLDDNGKVVTGPNGDPVLEKAEYSDRSQSQARTMLRRMMMDNANVVSSGLADTIKERQAKAKPVEAGRDVLERFRRILHARGVDPDKVIEDELGRKSTLAKSAEEMDSQRSSDGLERCEIELK